MSAGARFRLLALCALALSVLCAGAPAQSKARLIMAGKSHALDKLPSELPEAMRSAVERWRPFCDSLEYNLHAGADARLLLATSVRNSRGAARIEKLQKTIQWFDQRLPAVAKRIAEADKPATSPPEDKDKPLAPGESRSWSWSSEDLVPDADCGVLFVLADEAQYKLLLEELARQDKSLEDWTLSARKETGFVVPRPLCAAFLEKAAGMQEWDPEHELVNRCAQLLLVRRFGMQPFWVQQGIGWCAEWAYDGSLYCFPFRREFVYATEHGAWPNELKKRFASGPDVFDWATFDGWARGRWDSERARVAFGVLAMLLQEPTPRLSLALEELRVFRDTDNRRKTGEYSWERDPKYEIKAGKQAEVLRQHLGEDIGKRVVKFLQRGSAAYKTL